MSGQVPILAHGTSFRCTLSIRSNHEFFTTARLSQIIHSLFFSPFFSLAKRKEHYNLGQNKMEKQTPNPPKSRKKPREGQKRAIFPSLIWGGGGGLSFSFTLSKIVWKVSTSRIVVTVN